MGEELTFTHAGTVQAPSHTLWLAPNEEGITHSLVYKHNYQPKCIITGASRQTDLGIAVYEQRLFGSSPPQHWFILRRLIILL